MKLVNMHDSKSCAARLVGSIPTIGTTVHLPTRKDLLAYLIGLAIGDGNLSNPNGRATRLRISCDSKYLKLADNICYTIKTLLPENKVSFIYRKITCFDISCYSNKFESWLGWKAKNGSKFKQKIIVPNWIKINKKYTKWCLKGLFETDGSVYNDRNYVMAIFVTIIPSLAKDVRMMIKSINYTSHTYKIKTKNKTRYNIRVSKQVESFVKTIGYYKK